MFFTDYPQCPQAPSWTPHRVFQKRGSENEMKFPSRSLASLPNTGLFRFRSPGRKFRGWELWDDGVVTVLAESFYLGTTGLLGFCSQSSQADMTTFCKERREKREKIGDFHKSEVDGFVLILADSEHRFHMLYWKWGIFCIQDSRFGHYSCAQLAQVVSMSQSVD